MEQTLLEQNPHWKGDIILQPYFRLHDEKAISDLDFDEIQVVTGIRRAGKSTLLKRLIYHLMEKLDPKSLLYINFDDPSYVATSQDPKALYDLVTTAEKITSTSITMLFLDEVQNMNAWEKYVKSVYDSGRFKKIVVTGSNGDLLNSDYASLLSGRYIETRLYPLSYRELLINHEIKDPLTLIDKKPKALALFELMLTMGGFPRIHQLNEDAKRIQLLKSYYETIVLKDCIVNHTIRDSSTLQQLAHYLVSNNGAIYSYNSLVKVIGSNENTLKQFISIFQNAYFMKAIYQFSFALKKQTRSKKKSYCIDNGLISATSFKVFDNRSKLLENLVYTELAKIFQENVYFHHDTNECDFIIFQENFRYAIQVCYELTQQNRVREMKGLTVAMDKFAIPKGIIITYDQAEKISDNIRVVPFWKIFSSGASW